MGTDTQKVTLGLAILVGVGASMTGTYVRFGLVLLAIFLILWGRHPDAMRHAIAGLPFGDKLAAGLDYLDTLLATESAEKRKIRNSLGAFLAEGEMLSAFCAREQLPPPEHEAVDWYHRVVAYLNETPSLGTPYAVRFNSSSGLPLSATSTLSAPHRKVFGYLKPKLARLHEFISELRD